MAKVQQRFLIAIAFLAMAAAPPAGARKFYPDDPLRKNPPPRRVENPLSRKLSEYYDYLVNTFSEPGQKHPPGKLIRAGGVNTLDEVPDNTWYTNRHAARRMSLAELKRGPGNSNAPAKDKPLKVLGVKTEGITPGFTIQDSQGRTYLVKVDPLQYPELSSAADVMGSKFFYAFGYNVPENYIVTFRRSDLEISKDAKLEDAYGKERLMRPRDLDEILLNVPKDREGAYRGVASYFLKGKLLGPFRFYGTRKDDPNDIIMHEHRRDLRGLYVFGSWVGHNDFKSLQSNDALVEEGPLKYIRHYLLDFSGCFGSDSFTIKSPRGGNEYLFAWTPASKQFFSLGLYVPAWMRADYPEIPGVGRFESEKFDPEKWKPNYPNPAFDNLLPEDGYWAAKQVMRFTDAEIRALVETGEFSDPRAVDWLTKTLIERRNKIGRAYFSKVLALEDIRIANGRIEFEDLEVKYGFQPARQYTIGWSGFDNEREVKTGVMEARGPGLPDEMTRGASGSYYAATIQAGDASKAVTAYFRRRAGGGPELVGIERSWPPSSLSDRLSYVFEGSSHQSSGGTIGSADRLGR